MGGEPFYQFRPDKQTDLMILFTSDVYLPRKKTMVSVIGEWRIGLAGYYPANLRHKEQ